jgi:hypothetical protein
MKANKLNHARCLTYINNVLASISIYYMSTALLSNTFVEKINSIIRPFWWAGVQSDDPSSTIAYGPRMTCQKKHNWGLGIRDLHTISKSLILTAAWNIAIAKKQFLSIILKAKYFPYNSFWTAPSRGPSILQDKPPS